MFHKALIATGGSPWSRHAVETAVRLAVHLKLELIITHVLEDDPQYQPEGWDPTDPQLRAESEVMGRQILDQAVQHAVQAQVLHRTVVQWGSIPETIVRIATVEHCDLIVLGTRHLTGEKRLMTGRICNAVIAIAPCPVLVVPFVQ